MPPILTLTQVREHVETGLPDTALQRIIEAEDAEIIRRFGSGTTQTEMLAGGTPLLFLSRPVTSITMLTETVNDATTTLDATDYTIWWATTLERDDDGAHPASVWGERITVTYVPLDLLYQRQAILTQLVQLAVRYNGVQAESIGGDYSATSADYLRERERIMRPLAPRGGVFLA